MTVLCAIAECRPDGMSEPLRAVGAAGAVAILAPRPQDMWEHERTVSALMDACAILPARFGTRMSDEEADALVRSRRDELRAALTRVRGAVEVGVRARLCEPAVSPDAGPGATYLLGLRDRARALARLERQLEPLSGLSRAHALTPGTQPDDTLRRSYLVDRDGLQAFVDGVEAIDEAHPECELVCTGPWPPYSFAGALP